LILVHTVHKLYAAANAIFSHTKYVCDIVKVNLIEAYVLPIMMYALDAFTLARRQCAELLICWNNLFSIIFNIINGTPSS